MLEIKTQVEILSDDEELTASDFEGKLSGLMMYITNPELSQSGVCLNCIPFDQVVYDPKTMLSENGLVKVPEPGSMHPNCVCSSMPVEIAKAIGLDGKPVLQSLKERYGSRFEIDKGIAGMGKVKSKLIDEGLLDLEDLYDIGKNKKLLPVKNIYELDDLLKSKNKREKLIKVLIKNGKDKGGLKKLNKEELINRIKKLRYDPYAKIPEKDKNEKVKPLSPMDKIKPKTKTNTKTA